MAFDPAPIYLKEVLSPVWLSKALSRKGASVRVADASLVQILGPTATKARIALTFADPPPPGVPSALCIKGFFDDPDSVFLKSRAQVVEASFYRDLAPTLSLRVPRCLHAGSDDATGAGVIVMEDITTCGAEFMTALSPYSARQAKASLDQLARLHAASWQGRNAAAFPFITPKLESFCQQRILSAERVTELLHDPRSEGLPDNILDGARVYAALEALGERDPSSDCFVHGDCHAGNVFEAPEGIGLIDWQLLQRGDWAFDIAYHICAVLSVADRRAMEQDLLRHYLDCLTAHGAKPPGWDEAWLRYRRSVAYGYFLWAITQRVDPPIIRQFIGRLGQALVDHETFGLLGV